MAQSEVLRNRVRYYLLSLSTSVENINDSTARIHWTATVDFGDWYLYGVRLHVSVGGKERASGAGYTTSPWQCAVTVSGTTDAARTDSDYSVWCSAWTTSETVGGCGGVGSTTSCGENAAIQRVPAYEPAAPTDLKIVRSTDSETAYEWVNHPDDGARKYYLGINAYRHTDGGATETIWAHDTVISNFADRTTRANHYYDYDVRARWRGGTSGMSNSVRVYKTPAPPTSVALERSGDGEVSLTVRGADIPSWITGFEIRATADGGKTYVPRDLAADPVEPGVWAMVDRSAPAGESVIYEVRTYRDGPVAGGGDPVRSAWRASNAVATICPPHAPSVSLTATVAATGSGDALVTWRPNHPDGTAQAAAEVEVTSPDGTSTTVVEGATARLAAPTSAKGAYRVRVRTKGRDPLWGAWSDYAPYTVADPPQAFFSSPGEDGETLMALPLDAAWEAADETGIVSQALRLTAGGETVAEVPVGAAARSASISEGIANGAAYTLELTVRAGSGLSLTVTRAFSTEWAAPAAPLVDVAYDDGYAGIVTVRAGVADYLISGHRLAGPMAASGGRIRFAGGIRLRGTGIAVRDLPQCESYTLERVLDDGSRTVLATGLGSGQSAIDPLPPLNAGFDYVATGRAASGTTATTAERTECPCAGFIFNFGPGAAEAVAGTEGCGGPPTWSVSVERETVQYDLLGGGLPMGYESGSVSVAEEWGFAVDAGDYARVMALILSYGHAWARGHDGDRRYVSIKGSLSRYSPGTFKASLSTRAERWREP